MVHCSITVRKWQRWVRIKTTRLWSTAFCKPRHTQLFIASRVLGVIVSFFGWNNKHLVTSLRKRVTFIRKKKKIVLLNMIQNKTYHKTLRLEQNNFFFVFTTVCVSKKNTNCVLRARSYFRNINRSFRRLRFIFRICFLFKTPNQFAVFPQNNWIFIDFF